MVTNPEPDQVVSVLYAQRSIVQADANRPESPDLLELQTGMGGIGFEQRVIGIGQPLHLVG